MVKRTKPKAEYGYYCDLCGEKICKYTLDFKDCGGITILRAMKVFSDDGKHSEMNHKEFEICYDCTVDIAMEVVDAY